eukprot:CAMPEP_0119262428 /NCGR_PEP_ID=MMETSP1329-20130426/2150_1 /TAXON_ID=114041 /ORGANISM="Genus nov. species nov., Strain RCC1024" /LENGTH=222 /DNA_ID=CAMNT_0007262067 /DNA_START=846 /DNA_END=1511 /DNA_ORIENTATION=+
MRRVLALLSAAAALRLGRVDVVLVGPQYASNVGGVLRLCACFEVGRLRLVAPEYDREADATYERRYAMPAGREVLAERTSEHATLVEALADADAAVAFCRRRGAWRRHAFLSDALPALAPMRKRTALVFGREASGLTTEELAACGTSVEIESDDSLNLSHAVSIVLANLYGRGRSEDDAEAAAPADDRHVDALVARLAGAAGTSGGFTKTSRGRVPADPRIE